MSNSVVFSIAVQMSHASRVEHFIRYNIVLSLQECDVHRCLHRGTISMVFTCNNVRLISRSRRSTLDFKWQGWSKDFLGRKIWQVYFWVAWCKWGFFVGIQNNLKTRGSACVITSDGMMEKQTQKINVFYKFLRLGISAWNFLEVNFLSRDFFCFCFLPLFDHLRHLKSWTLPLGN